MMKLLCTYLGAMFLIGLVIAWTCSCLVSSEDHDTRRWQNDNDREDEE